MAPKLGLWGPEADDAGGGEPCPAGPRRLWGSGSSASKAPEFCHRFLVVPARGMAAGEARGLQEPDPAVTEICERRLSSSRLASLHRPEIHSPVGGARRQAERQHTALSFQRLRFWYRTDRCTPGSCFFVRRRPPAPPNTHTSSLSVFLVSKLAMSNQVRLKALSNVLLCPCAHTHTHTQRKLEKSFEMR